MATEDQKTASPQIVKIGDDSDYLTCELRPISIENFDKLLSHCKAEMLRVAYMAADGMPDSVADKLRSEASEDCSSLHVGDRRFIRWCLIRESARSLAVELCAKPSRGGTLTREQIRKWFAIPESSPEAKLRDDVILKFFRDSGFYIPTSEELEKFGEAGNENESEGGEAKKKESSNESESAPITKSSVALPEHSAAVATDGQ